MANQDRRMVPYGIDLNSIPKENLDSKALIPVSDALPLATIPPKPHSYGQSYLTQSVLAAPPHPLLLEDASPKGPVVKLPAGTKILPPKHNETLVGVKTNKSGEIACGKYSTREHTYFEGVCAHPNKVKFLPSKDAPKRALAASEAPRKHHKTVADLEKELEAQCTTITSMEASLRLHSHCIIHTNKKLEDVKKDNKKLDKRVSALEPPKPKK
jgi:hypothetical protein